MTWNTVNVLGISCAGNTAMKLAWEILNVFAMHRMGFWWVLYPFPCNVLAVYPLGTLALAPSEPIWYRGTVPQNDPVYPEVEDEWHHSAPPGLRSPRNRVRHGRSESP